jgi:hypothetical protein
MNACKQNLETNDNTGKSFASEEVSYCESNSPYFDKPSQSSKKPPPRTGKADINVPCLIRNRKCTPLHFVRYVCFSERICIFILVLFLLISILSSLIARSSPYKNKIMLIDPNGKIESQMILFGEIVHREKAKKQLLIKNVTWDDVDIYQFRSSCSCIRIVPGRLRLHGKESLKVVVAFNPADEPEFQGSLDVDLEGINKKQQILFKS